MSQLHLVIFLLLGVVAGGIFLLYARAQGDLKERLVLASGLIVAAVIYIGFGLVLGDVYWVGIEAAGVVFYTLFVIFAYRFHFWWLAIGWLLHVAWDVSLHLLGPGAHIAPAWYAVACIGFDVLMAGYILIYLSKSKPEPIRVPHETVS
ncbi:MAG: DUF6010 family protein [Bacteroidota bacterium]